MKLKQPDIKGLKKLEKSFSKPTPMMAQYLEVKERHQEYLLFYRMGDFYELFFDDAKIASQTLGIALTKRGRIDGEDIPMCGVPAHSSQTYLSRLIKQGLKVAIAEQLEPPKDEEKGNQKIFKRDVVKIITPGTILDDSLLDSKNYNHLLSIYFAKGELCLSWIDMTTGNIKIEKISGKNFKQDLFESIHKIEPGEIILSENLKNSKTFSGFFKSIEKKISIIPETFFDLKNNSQKVEKYLGAKKIDFVLESKNIEISSAGALINYLELTQKQNLPKIRGIEFVKKKASMQIDIFSQRSLEIFSKNDGSKKGSLIDVIDGTKTASGGRLLREFLKSPLIEKKEIENRHKIVELFLYNFDSLKRILNFLSNLPDIERVLARISAKTNNPRDLILCKQFIHFAEKVFGELFPFRNQVVENLIPSKKQKERLLSIKKIIDNNILDAPPVSINEGGVIKDGVNRRLDELRNIKKIKKKELLKLQEKYAKLTNVSNLKIKFNNIHGYFIEVTKRNSENLNNNAEFIIVQNTINVSRYQTKALREISLEIENSESESIILEVSLYKKICENIDLESENLSDISRKISFLDVLCNFANLSEKRNYIKPKILNHIHIDIKNGRHPVVEESLRNDANNFTPNDCMMSSEENIWIMTGPNMAGKSTFLRQTAVIILLNQIGCYVPADSANLGIFDKIFTRIGASDDLSLGLSTFMTEMIETSRIVNEATSSSLVILDELGRGTSSEDGFAIAYSVLEYIAVKIKCMTLFATHYKELCDMTKKYKQISNKTLKIKKWNDEVIFYYKIINGISQGSFGIHVANLAGVNKTIISRAEKVLKNNAKVTINEIPSDDLEFKKVDNEKHIEIYEAIKKLKLDDLSPKESLDILYTLKKNYFFE